MKKQTNMLQIQGVRSGMNPKMKKRFLEKYQYKKRTLTLEIRYQLRNMFCKNRSLKWQRKTLGKSKIY